MKKDEAERLIRNVVHDWARETNSPQNPDWHPSFYDFRDWLLERWPNALSFRSTMGAAYDAEYWFDKELQQTWRR